MNGSAKLVSSIVIAILAVVGGGWYFYLQSSKEPSYEYVVAMREPITQEVSVTGRVNPTAMADLSFSTGGIVTSIPVTVGSTVQEGDVVMRLDGDALSADIEQSLAALSSAEAQIKQYEALVAKEEATLADVKKGTRPEEIVLQEVKVTNAASALQLAKNDIAGTLEDAYTKADDAVHAKLDAIFLNARTSAPTVKFVTINTALKSSVESERVAIESALASWRISLNSVSTQNDLTSDTLEAKTILTSLRTLLDNAALLVASGLETGAITQTTLDGYASSISTARTNVSTVFSSVITKEVALSSAASTLNVEQQQLAVLKAGTTPEQITAQTAAVNQARANLAIQQGIINEAKAGVTRARTLFDKTILRSPLNGIVTTIEPEVGESVAQNTTVVSIISEGAFHIETSITETDIVLIAIGQHADITLDAYGDDIVFSGTVTSIDPAEKIIEGLPTYTVTLSFDEISDQIRSGMTANIDIVTAQKEQAITVPQRAIVTSDGKRFVRLLRQGVLVTVPVSIGLRDTSGRIEILDGVREGDQVITFIEEE